MSWINKRFSSDSYTIEFTITDAKDGIRLDQFLKEHFSSFSREMIKDKIACGDITIQGRTGKHKPSTKIKSGDTIIAVTHRSNAEDEYWRGELLELEWKPPIIFEDEGLIVCSKPAFMATHPTGRHLFNCATVYFESIHGHTIHSIHRLDRETSGLLLLGKNPESTQKITWQFENGKVRKAYFFIAKLQDKKRTPLPFTANERLGAQDITNLRMFIDCYPENSSEGKRAQTHFEELFSNNEYLLGLAFPRTGRQHQIRAHAAFHGYSLLGDKLYTQGQDQFGRFKDGVATEEDFDYLEIPRHGLHSIGLSFSYQDKPVDFIGPLPKDLREWVQSKMKLDIAELESEIQKRVQSYFDSNRP